MLESVDPAVVGLSKERLALIASWLEAQVTDGKLAGADTLIAGGKVAYLQCAGFADKEIGKVMDGTPSCASTPEQVRNHRRHDALRAGLFSA